MGASVVVVGGYGTVGSRVGGLLRRRAPEVEVVVAGRRPERAAERARSLPGSRAARVDVLDEDPLAGLDRLPDALVVAVDDREDRLLRAALRRGVPVVDVARWRDRVADTRRLVAGSGATAPVVLASGWMAGAAAVVAAATADGPAAQVDIDVLFALHDLSGPDSVAAFLDVHRPFTVRERGVERRVRGLSEPRRAVFGDGRAFRTRRVDTPDHETLVASGVAEGAGVRLAFDNGPANAGFAFLVRSGLWGRLPRRTRTALLRDEKNTGTAPHEFVVTVHGRDGMRRTRVLDPQGQAHLTAASAVSQVERVLGLRGRPVPEPGLSFPEQAPDPQTDLDTLRALGVRVEPTTPAEETR